MTVLAWELYLFCASVNLIFKIGVQLFFFGAVSNRFGNTVLLESRGSVFNLLKIVKNFADPQDPITACIQQSHAAI